MTREALIVEFDILRAVLGLYVYCSICSAGVGIALCSYKPSDKSATHQRCVALFVIRPVAVFGRLLEGRRSLL